MTQRWTTFFAAAAVLVAVAAGVGSAQQASVEELRVSEEYLAKAEQGDAEAQNRLGVFYSIGLGVPEDDAETVRWFRLAAEQGDASAAQYSLGVMYNNGEGVPQDFVQAHMWLNLATSRASGEDRERIVENRDSVAQWMTPDQLAEAQRLAREWDAAHPRD